MPVTLVLTAVVCITAYIGATGVIERFNTIPIRAVSTGLFVVALATLAIGLELEIATF